MLSGSVEVPTAGSIQPRETIGPGGGENMIRRASWSTYDTVRACLYEGSVVVARVGRWQSATARSRHWIVDWRGNACYVRIVACECGLVHHMGDALSNLDSAVRVSEAELAAPEVVGEHELDLVMSGLGNWCRDEDVGGVGANRRTRRVCKVNAGRGRLQGHILGDLIREDDVDQRVHGWSRGIPELVLRNSIGQL